MWSGTSTNGGDQSKASSDFILSPIHTLSPNTFSYDSLDATPRPDFPLGWLSGDQQNLSHTGTGRDEDALCTTRHIALLHVAAGPSRQASCSATDAPRMGIASAGLKTHCSC